MQIKCDRCAKITHHSKISPSVLHLLCKGILGEKFYGLIKTNVMCFECGKETYVNESELED